MSCFLRLVDAGLNLKQTLNVCHSFPQSQFPMFYLASEQKKQVSKNVSSTDVLGFILRHKGWGNGGPTNNPTFLPT